MPCHSLSRQAASGHALVMALVLLVVIGLTSVAAMRSAASTERAVSNARMENLSQQGAEMALRYCESEMYKDPSDRVPALQSVDATGAVEVKDGRWKLKATWSGANAPSVLVPSGWWSSAAASTNTTSSTSTSTTSATTTSPQPRCFVERVFMPGTGLDAYLVTARGYTPDFAQDSSSQVTQGGSTWLQSFLLLE